jgi:hypothetical protein
MHKDQPKIMLQGLAAARSTVLFFRRDALQQRIIVSFCASAIEIPWLSTISIWSASRLAGSARTRDCWEASITMPRAPASAASSRALPAGSQINRGPSKVSVSVNRFSRPASAQVSGMQNDQACRVCRHAVRHAGQMGSGFRAGRGSGDHCPDAHWLVSCRQFPPIPSRMQSKVQLIVTKVHILIPNPD